MAFQERERRHASGATHSPRSLSVYFIAAVASIGGLLFGYDTGVISGALLFLKQSFALNATTQEIAVSAVLVGAIIGAIIAGRIKGMPLCPETPRWLVSKGRWDKAKTVIEHIKGEQLEHELADIRRSLSEERQQVGVRELFTPRLRGALIVGVGLAVFQQLVGINTVIYYAPTIFEQAGFAN